MMRSILFVPADSERKLAKAMHAGADALVLDLEDAVPMDRKPIARHLLREWRQGHADYRNLWIRVNDPSSGELLKDLSHAVAVRPAGIMLPKIRGPEEISIVGYYLDALESEHGLPSGSTRIFALVTETPIGLLRAADIARQRHPRVSHVSWGAEDLSAALSAGDPRTPEGAWRPAYVHARTQCLLTAHALGAAAIDTVYVEFKDSAGLHMACRSARYDGFTGRIAIHPDQVAIINEVFTPTEAERALAQKIVDAFASGAGVVSIDGKMYDLPHLNAARRLLAGTNCG